MKTTFALFAIGIMSVGALLAAEVDISKLPPPSDKKDLTFEKDIHPLLEASCIRCHSGDRPRGGLKLDTLENALKGSRDGKVIVPGDSTKSKLVIAVAQLDPRSAMPPKPRQGGPGRRGPGGAPNAQGGMTNRFSGGGPRGEMGPPPKPLTPEQVGLIRAWIDQGAK